VWTASNPFLSILFGGKRVLVVEQDQQQQQMINNMKMSSGS
jgi:hypothetical protein